MIFEVAILLLTILLPLTSHADQKYWIGGTGWWDVGSNWSSAGQPQNDDDVYLTQSGPSDNTVYYGNTAYPDVMLNSLLIDATGAGMMTLIQDKDSLYARDEYIGYDGKGTFIQTGGSNNIYRDGGFYLGYNATGSGTYCLSGGQLRGGFEWIGESGTGTFIQTGGSNTAMVIFLGGKPSGIGIYNLIEGSVLTVYFLMVGWAGTGTFTQTGGFADVDELRVGSNGTYNLSAGEIFSVYGYSQIAGIFNQNGGTHTVPWGGIPGTLYIGSNGTYNLTDGTLTVAYQIRNNGFFSYSGGNLNADIYNLTDGGFKNEGITNLSGSGIRTIHGNVVNNGTFETTLTAALYTGLDPLYNKAFTNNGAFVSDSSVNVFTDLIIGEGVYMQGDWEDLWYVGGRLLGVKVAGNTVTNISGAEGMYVFYLPNVPENAYLGGQTYDLTGGGKLMPTPTIPKLVEIDVKPGTYPNDVSLNSHGLVPVAILKTADSDASSVDPGTVAIGGSKAVRWTWEDVNNDGVIDLLFHFKTQELDLIKESTAAILTGKTYDDTDVIGMDTVNIVPKKK
jgi:hypothetical protein